MFTDKEILFIFAKQIGWLEVANFVSHRLTSGEKYYCIVILCLFCTEISFSYNNVKKLCTFQHSQFLRDGKKMYKLGSITRLVYMYLSA